MNSNHKVNKNRASKVIIFLENETQVRDCLSWLNDIAGEKTIIALTPFAMHELDKNGMIYRIQEDYYDPRDLYKMGMANFQKVENLCSIIDGFIMKSIPSANIRKITPALFSFYHFKMIYDAMTVRIFQLSCIFHKEKPEIVYIYDTEKYSFGQSEKAPFLQFDNRESIYSQLLRLEDWKINIKILQGERRNEIEKVEKINIFSSINFRTYISKHLHNPELIDLVFIINKGGIPGLLRSFWYYFKPGVRRESVGLLGGGYEWHESIIELRKKKIGPIHWVRFDLRQLFNMKDNDIHGLDNVWEQLIKNEDFSRSFSYNDIDFFKTIEDRLEFLIKQITMACIRAAQNAEEMIAKNKIKVFISPEITSCLDHSVARIARNKGIPVITWQYGAYGAMDHPILNYTDLISSDFHFVYGKGVQEQYIHAAEFYKTTLVPVGSATLDRLQVKYAKERNKLEAKKTILYITNSYWQNNLYVSFFPVFSDNLFWRTQKAIVDTIGKYNEYSKIIKIHPSSLYTDPDFNSCIIKSGFKYFQIIKNEKSSFELLSKADIIVIDLPSTTLLQALTTTKPVFVYMGHIHFDKKAFQMLENRAVCSERIEDLMLKLDDYLKNGSYRKDVTNQDFLKMFGTYEGSAAQYAANKLREIIDENR